MNYEEKLSLLNVEDFSALFFKFNAEPRRVVSAGRRAIQILGKCHHSHNHSAVFDPSTLKVTCFSECGRGMHLHTWVKQALSLENPENAKEAIEDWIDDRKIDFSDRVATFDLDLSYKERPYEVTDVPIVEGIPSDILSKYTSRFDNSLETLSKIVWHTQDGIDAEILQMYDVSYNPANGTIVLPHHNIRGEVVGMFQRSFRELRRLVKKQYPNMPFISIDPKKAGLVDFPRAKYVPVLRDIEDRTEEKSSWSFPNSQNLYGFHLAAEAIRRTGKAIIFEGAKSVMLARQFGYEYSVATHTFGANTNHISMLIKAGAKEIILAFDKQYQDQLGADWQLYEKKTTELADRVGKEVSISRIRDSEPSLLDFKDSPIDKGKVIFGRLLESRELLTGEQKSPVTERSTQMARRAALPPELLAYSDLVNNGM